MSQPDQCWWECLFVPIVYLLSSQDASEGQESMAGSLMSPSGTEDP